MTTAEEEAKLFESVVGTVTLRVWDLGLERTFYEDAIGLHVSSADDRELVLSGLHGLPLVRLDSSRTSGSSLVQGAHTGLFHIAFRYPDRASLAAAVKRTAKHTKFFEGASDHGVSEAVYFTDPEGNGIELYRDRPFSEWPDAESGRVGMFTMPLDLTTLVAEADDQASVLPDIGHIHLRTADADSALAFWRDAVGLDERQRFGSQAVFLAEGLYHHHIGANSWESAGAIPAPRDAPGLDSFELRLRDAGAVDAASQRLARAGVNVDRDEGSVRFRDADENLVVLTARA